jgi:cytochrome P450
VEDFEGVELGDEVMREDPYPFYAHLRQHCPVYQKPGATEFLLTRHEDVVAAANDKENFICKSGVARVVATFEGQRYSWAPTLPDNDDPEHSVVRRATLGLFGRKRMRQVEPMIEEEVDSLIDAFDPSGRIEFVADFAAPLPARVIGRMLGLPSEMLDQLRTWAENRVRLQAGFHPPEERPELEKSFADFINYCGDQVRGRRQNPRDDGLTELALARRPDGEPFDLNQLAFLVQFIVAGGNETSTFMLVNALADLLRNPSQIRDMSDQSYTDKIVEETVRKDCPAAFTYRASARKLQIGNTVIPEASRVLMGWASASRDDTMFKDPDRFDVDREDLNNSLGFGFGPHYCIGAPLAKKELLVCFRRLFERFDISLAPGNEFKHQTRMVSLRSLERLHLQLQPRERRPA